MVEGGVEHALLLFAGAGADLHALEQRFPLGDQALLHAVEIPVRKVRLRIAFRFFGAEEGNAHFQEDFRTAFAETEVDLPVHVLVVGDRRVALDVEIDGVRSAAAPSAPGGGESADLMVRDHLHRSVQVGLAASVPVLEDEAGIHLKAPPAVFGIADTIEGCPLGGGDFHLDAGLFQHGGIIAEPDLFLLAQGKMVIQIHAFGEGHQQDVPVFRGSSRAADMQLAETAERHGDVAPAGIASLDVGGGLDHAEGAAGAHDDMPAPAGADGRVDVAGQVAFPGASAKGCTQGQDCGRRKKESSHIFLMH